MTSQPAAEPDPDAHRLTVATEANATGRWLRDHGCRVIIAATPGARFPGVIFQQGEHGAVQMAVLGDTLVAHFGSVQVRPGTP